MDISKYLQFLEDAGWTDLIDERWTDKVSKQLKEHFPDMTEEELQYILDIVIWK